MKTKTWFKDILLIAIGLASLVALTALLMASDRIRNPVTFHPTGKFQLAIESTAKKIDASFRNEQEEDAVQTADRADDLIIARRLALSLAGTIPSVEEIRAIEKIEPEHRIDWYVSRLLEDQRTSNYLAERFARQFVGVEEGPFIVFRRRKFVSWLAQQIHGNRPYDELARELLTDNGLWTDSPAVNFYTYNVVPGDDESRPDAIRLAARTSRAFLGMRIDCLQCHDDFLGTMNLGSAEDPVGGTQRHFHALASFFSQVENSLVGIRDNFQSQPYVYKLLDHDEPQTIQPQVPFLGELDSNEQNLRHRLANWIVNRDNRPFSRSIVNRVWAIMFGRGLIQPVDDIPLEGPFPEPMERLVDDFIENNFDLRRLIRVIAATQVFQSRSDAEFEIGQLHQTHWATFPMTRLRPDQVAGAIIQSTSLSTIDSTSHIITQLVKFGQQNDFVNRYGDAGEDEFAKRGETVTQRLLMLNGDLVAQRLEGGLNSPVRVAILSPDDATAVTAVYLAVLSRRPTAEELQHFLGRLADQNKDQQRQTIQDLYWTLINSVEFVWSH
jgi:hypothetical protein